MMNPVAIISAVPLELALLTAALEDPSDDGAEVYRCTTGMLGGIKVLLCATGVGKANAASGVTAVIERHAPSQIIITGCGGAYLGSGMAIGDLAVATDEIFADEGAITPAGWIDMRTMNLPLHVNGKQSYFNSIPLSKHSAEKAMQLADFFGVKMSRGRFATVSTCSGSRLIGNELAKRHQVICENMEGAAIALISLRYGLPCMEIRGISNMVEDRDPKKWDIPRAVEAAQRFVLKVVHEMTPAENL
jgi:futalosine hydrolase